MSQVRIAIPALFGSLFFLLLPMYDILLQQNTIVHPAIKILSVLLLIVTIITAVNTAKKFAYFTHDIKLSKQQKKPQNKLPSLLHGFLNFSFMITISSFLLFLIIKTVFLKSMTFFFKSFFGETISLLIFTVFFLMLLWSSFVLIRNHIDEKNPDEFISFWGKQFATLQSTSQKPIQMASTTAQSIHQGLNKFKPPFNK